MTDRAIIEAFNDHEKRIKALEHERECTRAFSMALAKVAADSTVAADKPACDHKYMKLIVGIDQRTHRFCPDCGKQDQPAGDDAEEAMYNIMRDHCDAGEYVENRQMREFARAIAAAMKRGEFSR